VTQAAPNAQTVAARPKLVFVHSQRSGRSRRVEGYLAQVLQRRHNHETFDIVWVDAETQERLVEKLGVGEPPALLVVEERRVRARLPKPGGCESIRAFLEPWLR
jgi:hypothetical protein